MRPLTPDDVIAPEQYLAVREQLRTRVRAIRADRRVAVGDRISVNFENRDTALFQIQEMVRVEEIRDPGKLAEEVAIYNDLVGGENELRATFFVEITDRGRIRDDLDSLVGLERAGLFLIVDGEAVPAEFEPGHAREDRISAVQLVRFALTPEQRQRVAGASARLEVVVDHPAYRARTEVGEATRRALAADLAAAAADPAPA